MKKIPYDNIDEMMRPIIRILNEKGWRTMGCCEGHWREAYDRYLGAYLHFDVDIKDEWQPHLEGYNIRPSDKKERQMLFKYENWYQEEGLRDDLFRWNGSRSKRMSKRDKFIEHNRFMNDLYKWAKGLPQYNWRLHKK